MAPQCFARINVHCRKKHIIEGSSFSFMGVTIKKVIPYGKKHLSRNRMFLVVISLLLLTGEEEGVSIFAMCFIFGDFVLLRSG